jgi:hypothetical protein
VGLGEVHPFVPLDAEELEAEALEAEEEEEEEELGILQYLDQLEQVTARFLSRLVLCYSHKGKWKETFSFLKFAWLYPNQMDLQEWISFVQSKIFLSWGY